MASSGFVRRSQVGTATVAFAAGVLALLIVVSASSAPADRFADRVFGQGASLTSNTPNLGGLSAGSLDGPAAVAVYDSDDLGSPDAVFVADGNNRVLEYDSPLITDMIADSVFGQADFNSNSCNRGGAPAVDTLCAPVSIDVDTLGNLYVADLNNNRVLEYDTPLTTDTIADRVYGQPNFSSNGCSQPPPSASTLCQPAGVAIHSPGTLYVSDYDSHRVLRYDSPLTDAVADGVIGQPTFGSFFCNQGADPDADTLCGPIGLAMSNGGDLFVADTVNNRVLEYDNPSVNTDADRVFGQPAFNTRDCNYGTDYPSPTNLCNPYAVGIEDVNIAGPPAALYVSDTDNDRVLEYVNPFTESVADRVFGQPTFTTSDCNQGIGPQAGTLCGPIGLAVDGVGNLYVADQSNSRVLEYDAPPATPTPTAPSTPIPVGGYAGLLTAELRQPNLDGAGVPPGMWPTVALAAGFVLGAGVIVCLRRRT